MATLTVSQIEEFGFTEEQAEAVNTWQSARAYSYECYMGDYSIGSCQRADRMLSEAQEGLEAVGLDREELKRQLDK